MGSCLLCPLPAIEVVRLQQLVGPEWTCTPVSTDPALGGTLLHNS